MDVEPEPTLFEWAGGTAVLQRLTRVFYETYVVADPLIGPLFAHMAPDHPERVADWLAEVFGGPTTYSSERGGYRHMIGEHLGKQLTEQQRARWAALMLRAADDAGLPTDPEFRSAFVSYIEWGTRLALENSQSTARPPRDMPMPKWDWGTAGPPGGRIGALDVPEPVTEPVLTPVAGQPISFATHVRPLFRASDRTSMRFAFDLWSRDDVAEHAEVILGRLAAGSMPCDGVWPAEHVATFRRWSTSGRLA